MERVQRSQRADLGVLGVGAIAEAIVTGLGVGETQPPSVLLSPRSRSRATALAERYPWVGVAADNQDLVSRSQTVLVCVRPQDAAAVLEGLEFEAGQDVVSVAAGVTLAELRQRVAPARALARAIPLPAVARRDGITAICPPDPTALALFERVGQTIGVDDEASLESLSASTATLAAHISYLASISRWLGSRGIPEEDAARYVVSMFASLADTLRETPGGLERLAAEHATPGGLNEQFLAGLRDAGAFELVARGLDDVRARLGGR